MQLGTRWARGAVPPASVPEVLRSAIANVEADTPETAAASYWTLTWLEGRPLAELDSGWEVLLTPTHEVITRPFQD